MKKYGFIYIWFDRKHKRYYIGCHWGNEDDGYICSSRWMRKAYKRRPEDFKRKILLSNIQSRVSTFHEEHKWLQKIKENELGRRYYNLRNDLNSHWTSNEERRLSIGEKISNTMKTKHQDPEYKKIYEEGRIKSAKKNKGQKRSEAFVEHITEVHRNRASNTKLKISENNRRLHEEKRIGMYNKKHSAETRLKQSEAAKKKTHVRMHLLP